MAGVGQRRLMVSTARILLRMKLGAWAPRSSESSPRFRHTARLRLRVVEDRGGEGLEGDGPVVADPLEGAQEGVEVDHNAGELRCCPGHGVLPVTVIIAAIGLGRPDVAGVSAPRAPPRRVSMGGRHLQRKL